METSKFDLTGMTLVEYCNYIGDTIETYQKRLSDEVHIYRMRLDELRDVYHGSKPYLISCENGVEEWDEEKLVFIMMSIQEIISRKEALFVKARSSC